MRPTRPAGDIVGDITRPIMEGLTPTIASALRSREFSEGVGRGIVSEMRAPASQASVQMLGREAGKEAAREGLRNLKVPVLIVVGLFGAIAGAVVARSI